MYVIFHSGRLHRQFVPISKILKPVLNECVTPVTCYWSLALLLRDGDELMLVFKVNFAWFQLILKCTHRKLWSERDQYLQKFHPPLKMLVPIWKALCMFTNSDSISASVVLRPDDFQKDVVEDGVVESWIAHGNYSLKLFLASDIWR
jgi:phosphatidylinositol glycan class H protein